MTLDDVRKIRSDMRPGHHILTDDVVEAIDWLADALREAQAQTVQMREDAMKKRRIERLLPDRPAVRTYEDGVRDQWRKPMAQAGMEMNGLAVEVVHGRAYVSLFDAGAVLTRLRDALLSPAPAVAPAAAPKPCPDCKHASHDGASCEHYDHPTPESTEEPWCHCDRAPKPVAFDAEAALNTIWKTLSMTTTDVREPLTMHAMTYAIQQGLDAGQKVKA